MKYFEKIILIFFTQGASINNSKRNKRIAQCIPGQKYPAQSTNHSRKNENRTTVSSIEEGLNQGTERIHYSNDPNITLILGLSGAGKSTFTQYITGDNSNLKSVIKKDECNRSTSFYLITDTTNKIGHGNLQSYTELPDLVVDPETNTSIYDCPGFSDTRDPFYDISGAYFIKQVTNRAKALKFVFVVRYSAVVTGASREEFKKLATHATEMIQNISKFKESIALIVTKIRDEISDEQRIVDIIDFLKEARSQLNPNETSIQTFIDILLTNYTSNDEIYYPRIGFMPKITHEGLLSEMEEVQIQRKELRNVIQNHIKYTSFDESDIKPTISINSVIYIDGLFNKVTKQVRHYMNDVVIKVQTFYDNLVRDMRENILRFTHESKTVDVSQSDAESFRTKLDKGSHITSADVKQIENIKDLEQISAFIKKCQNISKKMLPREIISNFSTQKKYLEFLFPLQKLRDSLGLVEWPLLSKNLKTQLNSLKHDFYENVSYVEDRIKDEISSIDNITMIEIQTNYSRLPGKIRDKEELSLILNTGYSKLEKIYTDINGLNVTYKCIRQIQETVKMFNFKNTNIGPIDDVLKKTAKYIKYWDVLQTLKSRSATTSFICSSEINRAISSLGGLCKKHLPENDDDENGSNTHQICIFLFTFLFFITRFEMYNLA